MRRRSGLAQGPQLRSFEASCLFTPHFRFPTRLLRLLGRSGVSLRYRSRSGMASTTSVTVVWRGQISYCTSQRYRSLPRVVQPCRQSRMWILRTVDATRGLPKTTTLVLFRIRYILRKSCQAWECRTYVGSKSEAVIKDREPSATQTFLHFNRIHATHPRLQRNQKKCAERMCPNQISTLSRHFGLDQSQC
jgi:hypothetical protein